MSHCAPETAQGSPNVTGYDFNAHRDGDLRVCGAATIVAGQSTVFVNGKLWAVDGDPNDHGEGNLIHTGTTIFIEGKPVIVDSHDPAVPDLLCGAGPGGEGGGSG